MRRKLVTALLEVVVFAGSYYLAFRVARERERIEAWLLEQLEGVQEQARYEEAIRRTLDSIRRLPETEEGS